MNPLGIRCLQTYPDLVERRLGGLVTLLVAFVVIIAVPRLLAPGLAARPAALPIPEPPPIGACLRFDPTVQQVPCTDVHDAEVTARWAVDAPGRPVGSGAARCRQVAFQYVALRLVGSTQVWRPAFRARSQLLVAPPEQRVGPKAWATCVVAPGGTRSSTGSVRHQGDAPDRRPAEFGECASDDGVLLRCDAPHRVEYLTDAVAFARSLIAGSSAARWRTDCNDVATRLLGRADPTVGGRLSVEFRTLASDPRIGVDPPESLVFAVCAVRATDDRDLTDSVFGLGDSDLPLV